MPNDQCVKFYCPSCGYVIIWRCESCRDFSRQYKCIGCADLRVRNMTRLIARVKILPSDADSGSGRDCSNIKTEST